jgi:hypothetical protein
MHNFSLKYTLQNTSEKYAYLNTNTFFHYLFSLFRNRDFLFLSDSLEKFESVMINVLIR